MKSLLKRKTFWAGLLLGVSAAYAFLYLFGYGPSAEDDTVKIALACDVTDESGREMINAVELHLEEINAAGGINGKKVSLDIYNDNNRVQRTLEVANEISQSDALLVIGHGSNHASMAAGKIYKKEFTPAITPLATATGVTLYNDWYFRVVSNDGFQGGYLAGYISNAFPKKKVGVIYSDDPGESSFAGSFEKAAKRAGVDLHGKWKLDKNNELSAELERITTEARELNERGILLLSLPGSTSAQLVAMLRRAGVNHHIFLSAPFREADINYFRTFHEAVDKPGYFSDGIYVLTPVVFDIANEKARDFKKRYMKKYGMEPGWPAASSRDAAMVAAEAMKRAGVGGGSTRKERKAVKEALQSMNFFNTGLEGALGDIYFDKNGDANGPLAVGVYYRQKLIPAFTQYKFTGQLPEEQRDGMVKNIISGDLMVVRDRVFESPGIVYTGIDINRIDWLDVEKSAFNADFYLWFTHTGKKPDCRNIVFINSIKPIRLKNPVMKKSGDGKTTIAYNVTGDFKTHAELWTYPFEIQTLPIKFKHAEFTRDELVYVPDMLSRLHPENAGHSTDSALENISGDILNHKIKKAGWREVSNNLYESAVSNLSSLGIREYFDSGKKTVYSEITAQILINKSKIIPFLKHFMPIALMMAILYSIYFIPSNRLAVGVMIATGVLITAGFYHMFLLRNLGMNYLIPVDYILLAIYAMVLTALFSLFIAARAKERGRVKRAKQLKTAGLVLSVIISFGTLLITVPNHLKLLIKIGLDAVMPVQYILFGLYGMTVMAILCIFTVHRLTGKKKERKARMLRNACLIIHPFINAALFWTVYSV